MINQKKFSITIKKPYAQWLNLKFNQILLHQVLILYIYIIIFKKKGSCDESFYIFSVKSDQILYKRENLKDTVALIDYSFDDKYLAIALTNG